MANNPGETDKSSGTNEPQRESNSRKESGYRAGVSKVGSEQEQAHCKEVGLMTAVVERANMWEALRQVERNRGGAGIDGRTVEELRPWFREHWPKVRSKLLEGSYQPQAVRRVAIPKPVRNPEGKGSESSASRPCLTGSLSRPSRESSRRYSTPTFQSIATAFAPVAVQCKPSKRRVSISTKTNDGS